jgi:zinc transport system permease protein
LLFYHKIFSLTFDEDFMTATGSKAKIYNLILASVIAVVIVLAMNLVGALLISALIVFPAMSAMRVLKTFKSVTICSVIVSVLCAAIGIIASILAETPVGSTIVVANVITFVLFSAVGIFIRKAASQ